MTSTFHNAFKIVQASVEKLKNFPLSCHQTFNTDRTSFIFHLHHGSKAPLTKDRLPPLFLESLVEMMTPTQDANAASPPLLHIRLIRLSTPMDPLVEEQETGVQLPFSLEDPLSSLKWLPPSKQKEGLLPTLMRRKLLPWILHYPDIRQRQTSLNLHTLLHRQ